MKRLLCRTIMSFALVTGLLSVSGCGQMGPLYMPAEVSDEAATPAAANDEKEQQKD